LFLIKKILYWPFINVPFKLINRLILSIFYNPQYLKGKYFDEKLMGWLWAWKGIIFKLLGFNTKVPWPMTPFSRMHNPKNLIFHPDSINVFQSPGCYFNNHNARIIIGKGVHIAPNVGIITSNHDIYDLDKHVEGKDVKIGDYCWIGMNSVILPGVELGPRTIVGAGAVVTKSFPEGFCIIAGVPARVIKRLDNNLIKNK
jgi:hypothetical protein